MKAWMAAAAMAVVGTTASAATMSAYARSSVSLTFMVVSGEASQITTTGSSIFSIDASISDDDFLGNAGSVRVEDAADFILTNVSDAAVELSFALAATSFGEAQIGGFSEENGGLDPLGQASVSAYSFADIRDTPQTIAALPDGFNGTGAGPGESRNCPSYDSDSDDCMVFYSTSQDDSFFDPIFGPSLFLASGESLTFSFYGRAGGDFALERPQSQPPVSPVPLPASAWLLGAALAGLGLMRRRSSAPR